MVSWVYIGIVFIAFVVFVVWGWGSASAKLKEHENKHPIAKTTLITTGKTVYLEIENVKHNEAKFEVQILDWNGIERIQPIMQSYNGAWENNLNNPRASSFNLIGRNRIKLIEADGELLNREDLADKSHHNVLMPSNGVERKGVVKLRSKVSVRIEVISIPSLKLPIDKTYCLSLEMVDGYETWQEVLQHG